jgi:hypothetical protein
MTPVQFRNAETVIYQRNRLADYSASLAAGSANIRRAMHMN